MTSSERVMKNEVKQALENKPMLKVKCLSSPRETYYLLISTCTFPLNKKVITSTLTLPLSSPER